MFIYEGIEGVDMVCSLILWCESNLALARDIVFPEEVLQSAVQDAAE